MSQMSANKLGEEFQEAETSRELQELFQAKSWKALKLKLGQLDAVEASAIMNDFRQEDRVVLFRIMPRSLAKEVFQRLPLDDQKAVAAGLAANAGHLTALLNDLAPDDRTAFFEELPGELCQRLMQLLPAEEREMAARLLAFPEDSIGRRMTPEFVAVRPQFTIRKALEHIRAFGRDSETLNVVYVVDEKWKLLDALRIREIILADPDQSIAELCDNRFVALQADDDQESAIKVFKDYDLLALPVIDRDGILLGIVTIDDIMDVVEEEHTEDFHKFGGAEGLDLSYTKTPLFTMVKKRAGWLVILFVSEMLTASAMGHFDNEISKAVVLALFVPLVISSGGNSGSQAASLIIRSLALDELKLKNWWLVMRKELLSGICLGTILGAVGFVRILVWQEAGLYNYGQYWPWLALSVSVSLIFIVMWGTLSGSMIPFILKRAGLDPATASAPFVATLVDVTGLIIYFTVAAIFLSGKLL